MPEQPVIYFNDVSKRFVFTRDGQQSLRKMLSALLRRRKSRALWAVQNVSFAVAPGEGLGIIGRNGSGKSTVLKLAARILRPTSGQVFVKGRMSALLELGAGFHPDLTGRENIFLNGSLLGLGKQDINRYFERIVDFSELDEFIDMPVKHYSSGMYMRLGFSVAVHLEPDILIVDEILAVGDQSFQNKCIERIYDMKRRGTAIVLVSHNLDTVRNLCSSLVWMDNGQVRAAGPTGEVAGQYLAYSSARDQARSVSRLNGERSFERWGTGEMEITAVRFLNKQGEERRAFNTGDAMTIEIVYQAHQPIYEPEFGLAIYRQDGVQVNGPNNQLAGLRLGTVHGRGVVRYCVETLPLLPAVYRVTAAIHSNQLTQAYDFHDQAYPFRVVGGKTAELHGLVALTARWEFVPSLPADKETEVVK